MAFFLGGYASKLYDAASALFRCANSEPQFSIANSHQVLPLSEVALEAHALGYRKRRDHATFDLLVAFSGALAS